MLKRALGIAWLSLSSLGLSSLSLSSLGLSSLSLSAIACGGTGGGAREVEYPDIKVQSMSMELAIQDPRKRVATPITEPSGLYSDEKSSFAQQLPEGFEQAAIERLSRLTGQGGLNLRVNTIVERADITFQNDHRGDLTRYDVVLSFRVTTEHGTLIEKGKGQAYQELPHEQATAEEMRRVFLQTSLHAFDQYFADEATLNKINLQIESYLKSHPDEKR